MPLIEPYTKASPCLFLGLRQQYRGSLRLVESRRESRATETEPSRGLARALSPHPTAQDGGAGRTGGPDQPVFGQPSRPPLGVCCELFRQGCCPG